jgi:type II secretory pathway pseudopilin PulG
MKPPAPCSPVRRRAVRAFTIVEVAMAAMVMALVLTTSITTLQHGFNAIDTARSTTLATQILQSSMENVRLLNWSQVSAIPASPPQDVGLGTIYGTGLPTSKEFACTISAADVSGQTNMKRITLTVSWTGLDRRRRSLNSTCFYCQNGLYDYFYTAH